MSRKRFFKETQKTPLHKAKIRCTFLYQNKDFPYTGQATRRCERSGEILTLSKTDIRLIFRIYRKLL